MANKEDQRERKTSTILAMDVVGYSEKMGTDEEGTVRQLEVCRGIVEQTVADYQGRIFNVAGDAFMVEFTSGLSALKASIAIQEKVAFHNESFEPGEGLEFRMGINMGDVVVDGDNLLGDGVNVAARLEGIAPPGGICISEIVYSMVKGKVSCGFIGIGKQSLKNISNPVTAYYADTKTGSVDPKKFKPKTNNQSFVALAISALVLLGGGLYIFQSMQADPQAADFQRIAILPLETGSDTQEILNLATGLTEDLGGGLSNASKKLTIVLLNEAPEDLTTLYSDLSARYFIKGRIRQSGNNLRISVTLTDTKNMATIWTKKYDKEFTAANIFSLQDEIVTNVIDSLVGNGAVLAQEVAKNFSATGTQNIGAYECVNFVRGQYFKVASPEMHARGLKCLRQAVIEDSQYKEAWALLGHMVAWGYSLYHPFLRVVDKEGLTEAIVAVDNAIRIDKNYARAYATRAELHFYAKEWDSMMANAKKAFELAPGDAYVVGHVSYIAVLSGFGCYRNPEKVDKNACDRLEWGYKRAILAHELDAVGSLSFENYGLGHYFEETGQWDKMLQILEEVPTPAFHWWNFHMGRAHHHLGNADLAAQYLETTRKAYLAITDTPLKKLEIAGEPWNAQVMYDMAEEYLINDYGWE